MRFYLRTWFILCLLVILSGLLFSVFFLSDVATELGLTAAVDQNPINPNEPISGLDQILSAVAPSQGSAGSRLQVVAFFDYQCPFCAEAFEIMQELAAEYPDQFYWQFRHFALQELSRELAEAAMCAGEQNQFWQFSSLAYKKQAAVNAESITSFAGELGLSMDSFNECVKAGRYQSVVADDFVSGKSLGVQATPTFFINGHKVQGVIPKEIWEKIIAEI